MAKIISGFRLPPTTGEGASTDTYIRGFRPYWRILRDLELPVRGPRGSAANRKRARMVQDALHAEKVRREKRKRG